jgi:pimeloyl-ACP methyl ester carboxylesterase
LSDAQPVLLLHGQPGSAQDWDAVRDELGDRARTIAIDRPGWDGVSRPGGLAESARAGVAALDAAGVERATVVGLSFGGAVAAWMAVHHPERVAALVLAAPAANRASLEPIDRLLALPVIGYVASAALLSGVALGLASRRVRSWFGTAFALPDDYLRHSAKRFRGRAAWDAFVAEQRALFRDLPVLERRLSEIAVPTTVVVGTADAVVPIASVRLLVTQIPGAELVEIAGAHHVLPAEHPRAIADAILRAG